MIAGPLSLCICINYREIAVIIKISIDFYDFYTVCTDYHVRNGARFAFALNLTRLGTEPVTSGEEKIESLEL